MKYYDIRTLEYLTGVKAHTIRIWEKRYKLLNPHRTKTNIRRYTNEHLKKLLNIKLLLDNGYKISEVAYLLDEYIKKLIKEIEESKAQKNENILLEKYLNDLIVHTEDLNEMKFEKTYLNCINYFGLYKTFLKIIYPFLQRVGLLWSINEISPLQEHFASQIIIRKIQAAIDGLDISKQSKYKMILFLFPNEYHSIPLLFSNYILRSNNVFTIYLGEDVPIENILFIEKQINCDYLLTFISTPVKKDIYLYVQNIIQKSRHPLIIGGNQEILTDIHRRLQSKKLYITHHPDDLIKIIKE